MVRNRTTFADGQAQCVRKLDVVTSQWHQVDTVRFPTNVSGHIDQSFNPRANCISIGRRIPRPASGSPSLGRRPGHMWSPCSTGRRDRCYTGGLFPNRPGGAGGIIFGDRESRPAWVDRRQRYHLGHRPLMTRIALETSNSPTISPAVMPTEIGGRDGNNSV